MKHIKMKRILSRLALLSVALILGLVSCKEGSNTIAGHEYVDLGLPSGLKWATCNVGATTPEEYGNYYAWGETISKTEYTKENCVTYGVDIDSISDNADYDAARANWGSTWRLPTDPELFELQDNCIWRWTTQNGVVGMKVIGPNGNSIFFPAAGYCDSTSKRSVGFAGYYWGGGYGTTYYSPCLECLTYGFGVVSFLMRRYYGITVRPVSD